jgi:hypothetical protein
MAAEPSELQSVRPCSRGNHAPPHSAGSGQIRFGESAAESTGTWECDMLPVEDRHQSEAPVYVRVMVNEAATPAKVVTVYRMSKIRKYWKATP